MAGTIPLAISSSLIGMNTCAGAIECGFHQLARHSTTDGFPINRDGSSLFQFSLLLG
jgi:hypothetical protein